MIDPAIYEKYKPLRNFLRRLDLENALYVIWAYINILQFNNPLPRDIEAHPEFLSKRSTPQRGLYEWELALLARELIVNAQFRPKSGFADLRSWDNLANATNKLKGFENDYWPLIGGSHNILAEIRRIAHRQFPWQSRPNLSLILRYFKIYSHPDLGHIIENRFGLSIQQWYFIGFALLGAFLTHPKTNIDPDIEINGLSKKDFDQFVKATAIDLAPLQELITKEIKYDDQFVYTLNPLEYYPLVRIGEYYYCPVVNFLAWRITSGIFFDLVKEKGFGHPFGLAFQGYLEEVATTILQGTDVHVIPEQKYKVGRNAKDSVDLILADSKAAIFVEAKAKRMQARSKSQLLSNEAIERDIAKLTEDVVQTYKTTNDYINGCYPHFKHRAEVEIFPCIVTLEEWYLLGEDRQRLEKAVRLRLDELSLPTRHLEEMPFTVCSSETFENLTQVLRKRSIQEVMRNWHKPEFSGHEFGQHLATTYKGEFGVLTDFFPEETEAIFPI